MFAPHTSNLDLTRRGRDVVRVEEMILITIMKDDKWVLDIRSSYSTSKKFHFLTGALNRYSVDGKYCHQ